LLGLDPPHLPARVIVRSGELFGVNEGTTRTALSRMVRAGELVADGDGYTLAGPLLDRHARQQLARSGSPRRRWNGAWEMAVIPAGRRPAPERAALRRALDQRKLAEWREGVWLRPANLHPGRSPEAARLVAESCHLLVAQPDADPRQLARSLWDLDAWAERARSLRLECKPFVKPLERGDRRVLADAFLVSATTLRHLASDPLLPDALMPARWPGTALRADYARFDKAFKAAWKAWFATQR
jgi:phenylacetic acid degradation operon negative regulatory protein